MDDAVIELHDALVSLGSDNELELINVKFFLGKDRNVTQEQLCLEASKAVKQIHEGKSKIIDNIDKDIEVQPLEKLLA